MTYLIIMYIYHALINALSAHTFDTFAADAGVVYDVTDTDF